MNELVNNLSAFQKHYYSFKDSGSLFYGAKGVLTEQMLHFNGREQDPEEMEYASIGHAFVLLSPLLEHRKDFGEDQAFKTFHNWLSDIANEMLFNTQTCAIVPVGVVVMNGNIRRL